MFKATVDAGTASRLFNLSEYQVVDVTRDGLGRRTVVIATCVREAACPACGVATSRVHQRTVQRVRDVPFDGRSAWCGSSGAGGAPRARAGG